MASFRWCLAAVMMIAASARAEPELLRAPDVRAAPLHLATSFAWPLTRAPSLLPHAPVDLARCAKAPALGYAHAWCDVGRVDVRVSLSALRALAKRDDGPYSRAARADLVDLLADRLTAAESVHWLADVVADAGLYDQLAATLIELGRPGDATTIADAVPRSRDDIDIACQRGLRRAHLHRHDLPTQARDLMDALSAAGHPDEMPDACDAVVADEACVAGLAESRDRLSIGDLDGRCADYGRRHPDEHAAIELAVALAAWPPGRADWPTWIELARHAAAGLSAPGAEEVAIVALTNASLTGDCAPDARTWIAKLATQILGAFQRTDASDARLRALLAQKCAL